eukprot:COSAG05_NODE_1369_length_5056_cov_10.909623_4_plen_139_part_00
MIAVPRAPHARRNARAMPPGRLLLLATLAPALGQQPLEGRTASAGCRATPPACSGCLFGQVHAGMRITRKLKQASDGAAREYHVHVPVPYDPQRPVAVVLAFHGWGDSGLAMGDFVSSPGGAGFLLVSPEGHGSLTCR